MHQGRESDESLSWSPSFSLASANVLVFSLNSCQLIVTFSFVLTDRLLRLLWFSFYNTQSESVPSSLMMNISLCIHLPKPLLILDRIFTVVSLRDWQVLFKIWESNFPEENIQVLIINLFPWCSYLKTFTFNLVILVNEKIV